MTLTQLEYTLAVAEQGNFTLAAEKCFVTQPTLSMQVQKLEDELGVKLFNRNAKPIALTQIGTKILNQADNTKGWEATKSNDESETPTVYDWNGTAWVSEQETQMARSNGGIIGKSNQASFGKGKVTSKTSSGNITLQTGTRVVETLVVGGGGGSVYYIISV